MSAAGDGCSALLMRALLFAAALWTITGLSLAAEPDQRFDDALKTSQRVIGTAVPDFTFLDPVGKPVRLSRFRGKPLLVNLIYTSCGNVCPTVIESLATAATAAAGVLGEDSFNIITVGFDTRRDTPARMQSFAKAHAAGGANWYFLAADDETIDRFTSALGFDYFSTAGAFDHMAQITVIDKDGRIYDQVYGGTFDPPTIVEPLKRLILGGEKPVFSLAGLADRVQAPLHGL